MHHAVLSHDADAAGWRALARRLAHAGVAPEHVQWSVGLHTQTAGLFDDERGALDKLAHDGNVGEAVPTAALRVPQAFLDAASQALLHSDPHRFARLYRLLWRLQREPGLRADPLDADWVAVNALAQAVHRDQHKMRAFVRFHDCGDDAASPLYVAWFEPEHHIVESQAGFFQRRFAAMRWAIVTPRASLHWDGRQMHHGPGGRREDVPREDATQALWLTYYAHIFNPARLKPKHMAAEMPRRYWPNLPEARLIAPLVAEATQRAEAMVDQPPTTPRRGHRPLLPLHAQGVDARAAASRCTLCPHAAHATQAVWGEGPADARVMLVGEQPGDQEDLQGRPFVGPAGQLLDRALAAAGLVRDTLYLTNAVKHFKFELRGRRRLHKTPAQRDIEACGGWLAQEIERVNPRHLVALGATAAQALLGRRVPIAECRGRWLPREDGRDVLVTWHPAALLRLPAAAHDGAYTQWVQDLAQLHRVPGAPSP
jgi:DNA polymerase